MLELTEWFAAARFPERPWLMLGKGPTFDRRDEFDLSRYNLLSLNHVVNEVKVDVAHIIDANVVGDCAEALAANCEWLLMPRYPHLRSTASPRPLEDWFDELPVLRDLSDRGRLVWYNLHTGRAEGQSPVITSGHFSSEAALRVLARMGVDTVRTLGIEGGRSYSTSFTELERSTLLENGAEAYDQQFQRLEMVVAENEIDFAPLVEPFRVFIGTEDDQVIAHRVLEYSIRKSSSVPVEITPMLNLPTPIPKDPANRARTTFSFARFAIPELCGYRGRALYLDADMVVFDDIAELANLDFGGHKVLCTRPGERAEGWSKFEAPHLGARSVAVMLLDCERLDWDVKEIVAGLDEGRYTYEQLMSDVCVVEPHEIGDTLPPEWNHLEQYEPGNTKLLHYTVVPTQPWKNDDNPLADVWMSWYREAVEAGAVPPDEVEALIARRSVKPSLRAALSRAPSRRSVVTNSITDLATAKQRITELEYELEWTQRRLIAVEGSWHWRLSDPIVRTLGASRRLLRSLRSLRSRT